MEVKSKTIVAIVLTVYGIETGKLQKSPSSEILVATVLTVYGIETIKEL